MQNKSKAETAKLVWGESDNNHYDFMEESDDNSIDDCALWRFFKESLINFK